MSVDGERSIHATNDDLPVDGGAPHTIAVLINYYILFFQVKCDDTRVKKNENDTYN